jgi:hypothetical protein
MTLAGQVIDFYDDSNKKVLNKIMVQNSEIEKYASYEIPSSDEHAALPDDHFALIVLTKHANIVRKFPVNDEFQTWLSAHYFDESHGKLGNVEKVAAATNIRNACLAYEIKPPSSISKFACDASISNIVTEGSRPNWFDKMTHQGARDELTKTAGAEINARMELPDSAYALILDHEGEVARMYAMPDENHVKIASAYFKKYAYDLSPQNRHMFAANVLNRAQELNVELHNTDHLEKWASENYNTLVNYHIEQRRSLIPQDDDKTQILDKLASLRTQTDPNTFANALHEFDKTAGLEKYYDNTIPDPWESSMGIEKQASWMADVDGGTLTEVDLQKVAQSGKLKSHFGEAFQNQFSKHAIQIFESLPTPEKVVIAQIAKGQL